VSQILVIATHPDDEVLGCGGVMARHADAGDDVHVLVVTRGIPELFPPEVIEGTRFELARAHAVLGVRTVRFLDFPAPGLDAVPLYEVADAIERAVRDLRPSIVYCPHQGDLHGDHKAAFWATLVAVRPVTDHRVSRTLCYETLSETEWAAPLPGDAFVPTVFTDITTTLGRKLRACRCYLSQMKPFPRPRSVRAVAALARFRGATVGVSAAEGFTVIRDIIV
jgi:LmbE family N-acetylglucosaminyl deacetylase